MPANVIILMVLFIMSARNLPVTAATVRDPGPGHRAARSDLLRTLPLVHRAAHGAVSCLPLAIRKVIGAQLMVCLATGMLRQLRQAAGCRSKLISLDIRLSRVPERRWFLRVLSI